MYNNCKPCLTIREFFKVVFKNLKKAYQNTKEDLEAYSRVNQYSCVISEQVEYSKNYTEKANGGCEIDRYPFRIHPYFDPEKATQVQEEVHKLLVEEGAIHPPVNVDKTKEEIWLKIKSEQ